MHAPETDGVPGRHPAGRRPRHGNGQLDFRPHGLVTVRLTAAPRRLARLFACHFGPSASAGPQPPDVVVTAAGRSRLGPVNHSGPIEMVVPPHPSSLLVPLVKAAVALAALRNGLLPVHGGAFTYGAGGAVVTGSRGSGKTGVLLAAMLDGAQCVASEWAAVDPAGWMAGVLEPVRVRSCYLDQLPDVRRSLARRSRIRLAALGCAGQRGSERRHVDLSAEMLGSAAALPCRLERLLFARRSGSRMSIVEVDPLSMVDEMVRLLSADLAPLSTALLRDDVEGMHRELLGRRLGDVIAYRLDQPYPVDVCKLRPALAAALSGGGRAGAGED